VAGYKRPPWMAEGKAMQEQLPRCRGAAAFLGGAARLRAIKKPRCVALISAHTVMCRKHKCRDYGDMKERPMRGRAIRGRKTSTWIGGAKCDITFKRW
jgi:hypothetical protein